MNIDFESPRGIDPKNHEHVMFLAKRLACIVIGQEAFESHPEPMRDNGINIHPCSNNWWLYPPESHSDQGENQWRLVARYAGDAYLAAVKLIIEKT